ncbi:MAG TPA: hypothetical protein VNZ61_02350 [Roseomonas sp.]|nr:hypothetical protein [Roseomonas sp.]
MATTKTEMRFDDPALDGGIAERLAAKSLNPEPPYVLERTRTNQHGWTLNAMARADLGSRMDGLSDLEIARALAAKHLPHIDMAGKSAAYLNRAVELRHDEWQPPAGLTLRNVLQDADRPERFDGEDAK